MNLAKSTIVLTALAAVFTLQSRPLAAQDFQFQAKAAGMLSMETNEDARATYEALAERGGFSVIFPPSFQAGTSIPFRVDNVDVVAALDLLAKQTTTFWAVWDSGTILVAEDSPSNRRELDRQMLKTIYLSDNTTSQGLGTILNTLRSALSPRGMLQNEGANAIIIRETPDKIALAEQIIAVLDKPSAVVSRSTPVATEAAGVFLTEARSSYRTVASTRSQLKMKPAAALSFKAIEDSRVLYEKLAEAAGLNIVFESSFRSTRVDFRVDNLAVIDALDRLSLQGGYLWQPLDATTVLVLEDTQANRRDFERQMLKTIYLSNIKTSQGLNGIVNLLRTVLSLRGVFQNEPVNAILVKDTPGNIALAERIVADLDVNAGPTTAPPNPRVSADAAQTAGVYLAESRSSLRNAVWLRSRLKVSPTQPLSFNTTEESRALFEKMAAAAGLNVLFDRSFNSVATTLRLDSVDILDALDFLSLQTRNFVQPLDDSTIFVLQDTATTRRDSESQAVKVIYLARSSSALELYEMVNVLRTTLGLRGVFQSESAHAIVIKDIPNNIALAERIIADLNVPGREAARSSVDVAQATGNVITGAGYRLRTAAAARSQLQINSNGPVSIRVNQTPRVTYETLGQIAGLKVTFDARVEPGPATSFNIDNVEILEALDLLSFQTGHFWRVVDSKTILVAPDTPQTRREFEPPLQRTFLLANPEANRANEVITILRSTIGARQIQLSAANGIQITDTAHNIALAEGIIADLDVAP